MLGTVSALGTGGGHRCVVDGNSIATTKGSLALRPKICTLLVALSVEQSLTLDVIGSYILVQSVLAPFLFYFSIG